mgnify:CR=1 FL=1
MPFVRRDKDGKIATVFHDAEDGAQGELPAGHEDLVEFMGVSVRQILDADDWLQADLKLARVTEDQIDILIENGTISFTDLRGGAQNKLNTRQGLRSEMSYVEALFGSDVDNYL